MLQNLVHSARKFGIQDEFIAFSDSKLDGCVNEPLDASVPLDLSNYMFKFHYLKKLTKYDFEYFVFLDGDSVFVNTPTRHPTSLVPMGIPWHCFLESPINSRKTQRPDWWGVPNTVLTNEFRNLGVISSEIRNVNAGYWICKKQFIDEAVRLGLQCYEHFKKLGFRVTEEIPMSYISNYICPNVTYHFHERYADYWASDWTGVFKDIYPSFAEWEYESYMTGEKFTVKPSIIHAMRSKRALIAALKT